MSLMNYRVGAHLLVAALCATVLTNVSVPSHAQVTEGGTSQEGSNEEDSAAADPSANESDSSRRNIFIGNQAGIAIDAIGVLRRQLGPPGAALNKQRLAAAFTSRDRGTLKPSQLRKISLRRLEEAARIAHEKSGRLPHDMLYLAGLTRVTNVFLNPRSGDVVIAGPASAWFEDGNENVLALDSLQPVLRLKDLAVALRAFPPHDQVDAVIACSVDLTAESLDRMLTHLRSLRRPPSVGVLANYLQNSRGRAYVNVDGIPASTRFAHILVAASFRMQLIAMGREPPPIEIPSYVTLSRLTSHKTDTPRWYFTLNQECVQVDDHQLAMQLVGQRVRLISQEEFLAGDAIRGTAAERDVASARFASAFTKQYSQLALRSPVYAELRNVIDLSIVAAFLQQCNAYGRCHWTPQFLVDEHQLSVHIRSAPRQIATAGARMENRRTTLDGGGNGGGIWIRPCAVLQKEQLLADGDHSLEGLRAVSFAPLKADQWWWD